MSNQRLHDLFERYIKDECSAAEKNELAALVLSTAQEKEVRDLLGEYWDRVTGEMKMPKQRSETMAVAILQQTQTITQTINTATVKRINFKRVAIAASILLVIGLGSYIMFFNKTTKPIDIAKTTEPADVKAPQSNRAMITLANGQKIYLDSATNGELLTQGEVRLIKEGDGKITYQTSDRQPATSIQYNTLSNPRGSKVIDMTLADGSHVWLNAGSSITYPVSFIANERKVAITGEAYFEVAHDKTKPFYVTKADMQVQVLGTHFNVNAYEDEKEIKVTLLEGSVKVTSNTGSKMIKPGEQATVIDNSPMTIRRPDLSETMDWKDNRFYFMGADIQYISRQLQRWYDVEIKIEGNIPDHFTGIISRNASAAEVFGMLQKTGTMKVKIENKKITITK